MAIGKGGTALAQDQLQSARLDTQPLHHKNNTHRRDTTPPPRRRTCVAKFHPQSLLQTEASQISKTDKHQNRKSVPHGVEALCILTGLTQQPLNWRN